MSIETAKLKDLVYVFKGLNTLKQSDIYLTSKSKIFVVINGKETTIPIEKLFEEEPVFDSSDVEGYTILQMLSENKLKIDDNTTLEITFIDKTTETKFFISKIRRPFVYDDDIEITLEKRLSYVDLLLSAVVAETPRVEASTEPVKSAEEIKAEADLQAKLNQPGGADWEKIHSALTDKGCSEYIDGKHHFFYKQADENEGATVAFYILEPGQYFDMDLYEDDISDELEVYSFEDFDNVEWSVKFNKALGTLEVRQFSEA